jgi:hypothetical protein
MEILWKINEIRRKVEMKRKNLGGIVVFVIVIMATVNVGLGSKTKGLSDVPLTKPEAPANEFIFIR